MAALPSFFKLQDDKYLHGTCSMYAFYKETLSPVQSKQVAVVIKQIVFAVKVTDLLTAKLMYIQDEKCLHISIFAIITFSYTLSFKYTVFQVF